MVSRGTEEICDLRRPAEPSESRDIGDRTDCGSDVESKDHLCCSSTRGIILAGVHDWGGCALGVASPRPLLPVANRPLVTYSLDWLVDQGVPEICICANSDTAFLRETVCTRSNGVKRLEFYEDVMPRGPAGCARDAWCGSDCDCMLVVDGTIIPRIDLAALLDSHRRSGALMSVAVSRGGRRGGAAGDLLSPLGVYVMSRRVLGFIPPAGHCDIKEGLIPHLHELQQKVVTFMADAPSPRVTGTSSYMAINEWMIEQVCGNAETPKGNAEIKKTLKHRNQRESYFSVSAFQRFNADGYRRVGEALVHSSATVDPGSKLIGPVMVGPGGKIGPGVTIVGPVSIGADCVIESGAVICRSAIWDRCRLDADVTVDRCVLTHGARLRAARSVRHQVLSHKGSRLKV